MNGIHKRLSKTIRASTLLSLLIFPIIFLFISFTVREPSMEQRIQEIYAGQLLELKESLIVFKIDIQGNKDTLLLKDFKACRKNYKKAELLIAYKYPLLAKRLNGPALMDVEPIDPNESVMPTGFQVIEEELLSDRRLYRKDYLLKQLEHVITYVSILQRQVNNLVIGRSELYDAIRLNLCNMAAMGLSGFDTPLIKTSLEEAITTLTTTRNILQKTGENSDKISFEIDQCISYFRMEQITFDNFDRGRFLVKGLRPLFSALYNHQRERNIPFLQKRRAIKTTAASFFEADAFDAYFFAPDSVIKANKELITLGKALFFEPALSASGRSCSSCHNPSKAYTDGLKSNQSLQRDEQLPRNTPTIINAALQPVLFADSRVRYLEEQAHEVINNKEEMDGGSAYTIPIIAASDKYVKLFSYAFPGKSEKITQGNIIAAITAFERSLIKLDAPFDKYMRGDTMAMTPSQIHGFNLFMGKAKCGTCHFMPLFNGAVPPFYDRQDAEIIGVPAHATITNVQLDQDLGVYDLFHSELKRGAFKTPSIRNAAWTAPYMHNGVYKTLEEVIDFYDKGGGIGLGINMQQQTLPEDKLNLDPKEKMAIIAFIKSLSDK